MSISKYIRTIFEPQSRVLLEEIFKEINENESLTDEDKRSIKQSLTTHLNTITTFKYLKGAVIVIGLIIPIITIFIMMKANSILSEQLEAAQLYNKEQTYLNHYDRLLDIKNYNTQQRQMSLGIIASLADLKEINLIEDLDLRDLELPQRPTSKTFIRDSIFSGEVFSRRYVSNYVIEHSLFENITSDNSNYYVDGYSDIRIEVGNSTFKDSTLNNIFFFESSITATHSNTKISNARFCNTFFNIRRGSSISISRTNFYCDAGVLNSLYPSSKLVGDATNLVLDDVDFSYADLTSLFNLDKAKATNVCGNGKTKWGDISFPNCDD